MSNQNQQPTKEEEATRRQKLWVIITPTRVVAFTSWARAQQVYRRAVRMGLEGLEFVEPKMHRRRATVSAASLAHEFSECGSWCCAEAAS